MNISGKYLKVWKKEVKNGFMKLDLGDSKKNKDGSYKNWTWYGCTLFGKAKNVDISKGDIVEVKSGIISQRKYKEKWYNDIVIFDIEVMRKNEASPQVESTDSFEDDIPF